MYYYKVLVASHKFHGETLTYHYGSHLTKGTVVIIPMQRQTVPGIAVEQIARPNFKTKSIVRIVSATHLPPQIPKLIAWLKDYYPAPLGQLVSSFIPANLVRQSKSKQAVIADQGPGKPGALPSLTEEQTHVMNVIRQHQSKNILLHGDTGTGKTRIYLELVKETLSRGESVILLTPEIGLTPQLVIAANQVFPGQTLVVHSDLSQATRRTLWLQSLESDQPKIIIGARSALFSPVRNVGLIVIDEFHETSYKQDQAPHYLTSRVAAQLARLHGARLVLGSATPPVSDYYAFKHKKLPIIRMKSQALQTAPPEKPTIIDLKNRKNFRTSRWLSDSLIAAISHAIQEGNQSLVFLNRRGTARIVLCQNCGWEALCPRCDLSLTYHGDSHNMQCHTCGFIQKTPSNCPNCSDSDIIFRAIGTKTVATELQRLFPNSIVKRFDSDTAKTERLEHQFEAIRDGKVDILVGTQMLGKGLDLPKLSVLGIALADTSLSFPDYTAEERTFQLLTQVMGRVNRGHVAGSVYIQTYHPESPIIRAAIDRDYERFFELQVAERRAFGFPPFRYTLKLGCNRSKRATAEQAAQRLVDRLRIDLPKTEVIGPAPGFIERIQNRYRWQVIVKATDRSVLTKIIRELPANWTYDIDPINLL